ncbi:restriction endonuclease [Streptomyces marispadix]|uniref:Restriction endonuclease n=1 Tax=Streptomyces marispadix TaxID=2922868 RepID=A0ABS9T266_9ACTN|nr:restriction endonuclease [Streptomyces marispadix]MCH6162626.1 restriction endonuclease [Streptomyces marispadix]
MHDDSYHWTPELLELLIETIPLLCRSKVSVLDFLRSAGVDEQLLAGLRRRVRQDRDSISKYAIARDVLRQLNERGDRGLGVRREVLRRVTEFEDFATCWPDDQLKAEGLVAKIRKVVDVKDSFTRMRLQQEEERKRGQSERQARQQQAAQRRQRYATLRAELSALFSMPDPHERGVALEALLNKIFAVDGLLIREAFVLRTEDGQAAEQIDGAIELDGSQYLVEVKWWGAPLGKGPVAEHLVRVYGRAEVRGLMISASGFTGPAVEECTRVLAQRVMVLGELRELVLLLEQERDLVEWLREKVRRAVIDREPLRLLGVDF